MEKNSFVSFNARGLRNRTKRRSLFRHLHVTYRSSIIILQETHSTPGLENIWKSEWRGNIVFSHGSESGQAGVAILFPSEFKSNVEQIYIDDEGRVVCLGIGSEANKIICVGIYAPSVDNQTVKCTFLDKVRDILSVHCNSKTVMCGDFNIKIGTLDSDSDKFRDSRASIKLQDMISEFSMIDVWRSQHWKARKFTWRRTNPLQQSRIDYIFINSSMMNGIEVRSQIDPGVLSDHNFVTVNIEMNCESRGPGLWRFNNKLLDDEMFVSNVKAEIESARNKLGKYADVSSQGLFIELLLGSIRVLAIKRSKRIAFESRQKENRLYEILRENELSLYDNPNQDDIQKYEEARRQLDDIKNDKGKRAMLKSQAAWLEDGEKPTQYFFRMVNQRAADKAITVLQDSDGKNISGNRKILDYCANHYSSLYSSTRVDTSQFHEFALDTDAPRLSDAERDACEGPVTIAEGKRALSDMAKNKTAGISGFSAEFFSAFWEQLGESIIDYFNDAKERRQLFITHRRGVLNLIPKKGDQKVLQNKRPICLLDVMYKLLAKILANRLNIVLCKIIHPNQSGFMKKRFIGENIRLISDVIEYCKMDHIEGLLLAIDYRNAFDTLEHELLWYALESFNFGPDFCSWIKLLYNGALLTVSINGFTSEWFPCSRGTFQGSPLSGMLFNLTVELLANKIRSDKNVEGIVINDIEIKLSQYADDTTMFIRNQDSCEQAIGLINKFSHVSGLRINTSKSKLMWLGSVRHKRLSIQGIDAVDKMKILGVWFSASACCEQDNSEPVLRRIKKVTNNWSQRSLTLKGRITVTKSLLASQMVYLANANQISKGTLKEIQSHIMKYLWRGRPPKVAFSVLRQDIREGGLKATDVAQFVESIKLTWIKRIFSQTEAQWRQILQARIPRVQLNDLLRCNRADVFMNGIEVPQFYKEVIVKFHRIVRNEVSDDIQARCQNIWCNDHIKINGNPCFIRRLYDVGVKVIHDLISDDGNIMNYSQLKRRFPNVTDVNFLTYMGLVKAIPMSWKKK